MAGKQRPDFSTREMAIQRELGNRRKVPCPKKDVGTTARSPHFKNWTNNNKVSSSMHKGLMSSPKLQYPLKFPRPPTPSPQPQNPVGVISIKDEPYTEEETTITEPIPNPKQPFQNFPSKPRSDLKRKAPENNNQQQQPSMRTPVDSLFCELCQAVCSSARTMQQHLNGRPHKAKLEWARLKRSGNREGKAKHMCDVCGIWCSDKDALAMHFKGQKHKTKLREVEMCEREGVGAVDKKPIMCELCGVSSMNGDLFAMHLKGRQHVAKQEALKHMGTE